MTGPRLASDAVPGLVEQADADLSAPVEGESSRPVWQNLDFLRLWLAQGLSHTVQNAAWFALWVLVEEQTRSSTQLSLAIVTSVLPSILFGAVSGVIVDRTNKRVVLIGAMLLRIPAIIGFMIYTISLPLLYCVNFIFNTIGQFFNPAEGAKIPMIVSKNQLITAQLAVQHHLHDRPVSGFGHHWAGHGEAGAT